MRYMAESEREIDYCATMGQADEHWQRYEWPAKYIKKCSVVMQSQRDTHESPGACRSAVRQSMSCRLICGCIQLTTRAICNVARVFPLMISCGSVEDESDAHVSAECQGGFNCNQPWSWSATSTRINRASGFSPLDFDFPKFDGHSRTVSGLVITVIWVGALSYDRHKCTPSKRANNAFLVTTRVFERLARRR